MKTAGNGSVNIKNIALTAGGGAVVLLVAAQLLAKPNVPPVAKVAARTPSATPAGGALQPDTSAAPPLRLAVAGERPIREMFRPLITRTEPGSTSAAPALPVNPPPSLPGAGDKKPADDKKPETTAVPQPVGPRASDIQMLGVVELGGEVKALLKNTATGERRYFAKGEDAFGFKVGEIKDVEVSLLHEGRTERVTMSSAIMVEGPGGSSSAGTVGRTGPGGNFGNRGGGFSRGGDNGGGRGNRGGGDAQGFSTAEIFSLPTWAERLKKLDEVKGQLDAERYQRLRKFMAEKAAEEAKGK